MSDELKIPKLAAALPPDRLERLAVPTSMFIAVLFVGLFTVGAFTKEWTPFIACIPVLLLAAGAIFGIRPNRWNGGG